MPVPDSAGAREGKPYTFIDRQDTHPGGWRPFQVMAAEIDVDGELDGNRRGLRQLDVIVQQEGALGQCPVGQIGPQLCFRLHVQDDFHLHADLVVPAFLEGGGGLVIAPRV